MTYGDDSDLPDYSDVEETASAVSVPAVAEPAAAVPAAVVRNPTIPAAVTPTPTIRATAESAAAAPAGHPLDMAPPPTTDPDKVITQYARLQEDQPAGRIISVRPDIRTQHALHEFRYLRGNAIKSFINHRVRKLAATQLAQEAKVLENRVSGHIMVMRNAGLDRVEAANAGVRALHTSLRRIEKRFATDEVLALRNDNFELTREIRKRETDWRVLWAYSGELRERYEKVRRRALLGMSEFPGLRIGVRELIYFVAERELFDVHDRAAAAQLQAEFKQVASVGYQLWLGLQLSRLRSSRSSARDE